MTTKYELFCPTCESEFNCEKEMNLWKADLEIFREILKDIKEVQEAQDK